MDHCQRWFLGRVTLPTALFFYTWKRPLWVGVGGGGADALLPPPFHLQGVPFPQNEANAMDVVVQFAVHRLGFQPQDIIIYAWSIGGFTGTSLPPTPTVGEFVPPPQGEVGKCTGSPEVE